MKKLLTAAALLCALLFSGASALAQPVSYTTTIDGARITVPVGPANPMPVRCYDTLGVAESCGGGGGGGAATLTPFAPVATSSTAPGGTTGRIALPSADTTILLQNPGSVRVYFRLGNSAVNATTGDTPLGAGMVIALSAGANTHIAFITDGSAGSVNVTTGTGTPTLGQVFDPTAHVIVDQGTGWTATGVAQGSTTAGQLGTLGLYAVTTANPTYTNGQSSPPTMTPKGNVRFAQCDDNGCGNTTSSYADTAAAFGRANQVDAYTHVYNGATNDRIRGNTTGLAVLPYGMSAQRWSYATSGGATITNTTTAVQFKAANASFKNCISSFQLAHDTLGAATDLVVRDGAAGTVIWRGRLQTAALPETSIVLPSAVCGAAVNTLMEVAEITAVTGAIYFSAQGDVEP